MKAARVAIFALCLSAAPLPGPTAVALTLLGA